MSFLSSMTNTMTERPETPRFGMVGRSAAMEHLMLQLRRIGPYFRTVLLRGEKGAGKQMVARALHAMATEKDAPFVVCHASSVKDETFDSQLFGHLRGAFPGAMANHVGLLQSAHMGTLFFDEVGDLPLSSQARLLRALQQNEVRPMGAMKGTRLQTRVIASTSLDLKAHSAHGFFRHDLYQRFSMIEIPVPSLRDRMDDIPLLAQHFCRLACTHMNRHMTAIDARAIDRLMDYDWPGNVRELESVVTEAVARCKGDRLHEFDLPPLSLTPEKITPASTAGGSQTSSTLDEVVRKHVFAVLEECAGNKLRAAEKLGISRSTLYRMLGAK